MTTIVSDARLAHLREHPEHINPLYELPAIIDLALTAALSIRQGGVKALEWEPKEGTHGIYADNGFGEFYFAYDDGGWSYASRHHQSQGKTLEAAKTAAQADFNTRILSALASPAQVIADEGLAVKYRAMWQGEVDDFDLKYGKRIIGDEYERGTCDTHREEQHQCRVDTLREVLPVLYAITPPATP